MTRRITAIKSPWALEGLLKLADSRADSKMISILSNAQAVG